MYKIEPTIESTPMKKLVGLKSKMNLECYNVSELWKDLLMKKDLIENRLNNDQNSEETIWVPIKNNCI